MKRFKYKIQAFFKIKDGYEFFDIQASSFESALKKCRNMEKEELTKNNSA